MELQTAFETRRSIRHYDAEKKVTKEQVETLIKAASLAPSWKNTQTSRYYCVLSEDKVAEFSQKCLPEFNQKNSEDLDVCKFFHEGANIAAFIIISSCSFVTFLSAS